MFQIFKLMDILEKMRIGPGTYNAYDIDEVQEDEQLGTILVKKKRKIWSKDDACLVNYATSLKTTEKRTTYSNLCDLLTIGMIYLREPQVLLTTMPRMIW